MVSQDERCFFPFHLRITIHITPHEARTNITVNCFACDCVWIGTSMVTFAGSLSLILAGFPRRPPRTSSLRCHPTCCAHSSRTPRSRAASSAITSRTKPASPSSSSGMMTTRSFATGKKPIYWAPDSTAPLSQVSLLVSDSTSSSFDVLSFSLWTG